MNPYDPPPRDERMAIAISAGTILMLIWLLAALVMLP